MRGDANWERQVADNARRYGELHDRVSQLSITEASRDGLVRVTVAANGQLTDLVLRDRWHPQPMPDLAAQIMDCVHRAQAHIPDLLHQAMIETVGPDDPSGHLLVADARKRFPEPPPEQPTCSGEPEELRIAPAPESPPPAPRPSAAAHGEDDWDGRAVMEDV